MIMQYLHTTLLANIVLGKKQQNGLVPWQYTITLYLCGLHHYLYGLFWCIYPQSLHTIADTQP